MAALVERIAQAAGRSTKEIGIAFAAMVGDLSGTAEEVGEQIQAAMVASALAVELSNNYNDNLGQMLGLTGDIGSDVQLLRGYVNDFGRDGETSADTLVRLSTQLGLLDRASEQTSTRLEGLAARDLIALSTQLADAFGSLDTAAQAMAFSYDQFSTNAEKVGDTVKALVERILAAVPDLQEAMQAWSITGMPETREAFENLIAGLDLTTESGRLLYAELLKLAPAFDALYDSIEAFQDWLLGSDAVAKATAELTKVFGEWGMGLPATRAELEALYNSGAFTAEQLAILGGLLKELGLVFGDLGQAAEEVKQVVVDYTDLYIRLAEAQGNDALALQLRRQQELANAADDTSRAILLQIYALEDAAAAVEAHEKALAAAAAEAEKIRRAAYDREVEAIRARNEAAQRAADEANRAAEEALRAMQEQAREAAALASDIARAWLEALSAIGLATEALALQRKLQAAEMQPELRGVYSHLWGIQDRATQAAARSDLAIQALGFLGRDDDATKAERALTLAATDPALREFQEWVFTLEDAREAAEQAGDKIRDLIAGLKEVSAALGSTIDRLDELMLGAPEQQAQRRRDAQAELTAALRAARAGTMPTSEGLERTLDTLSQDPTNLFATRVSYLRDLGRTRGTAAELQALVDAQVPIEEQNLEALKNLPGALYPNFESIVGAIGQLDSDAASILKQASAAIDAAIAAIQARDDALKQSITKIVPAIEEIPPYIEAIPPKLIPLQSLAKDIVTNLAQIDLNVDGLVTFEEFASFFGKFMNAEDLARYFDLFDTNDDGIIDRLEHGCGDNRRQPDLT
ncbi:hypothetical protein EOM89_08105, partial [Candidatus Falkowbacteria bacterium]|nr:hypothetical protein [Candidatus Falkowbacteria bacterium]